MVGKKIRCRQCTRVFVIESPEASNSSSSTLGRDSAGLTKSQVGQRVGTFAGGGATTVLQRPPVTQRATPPRTNVAANAANAAASAATAVPGLRSAGKLFAPRPSVPQPFQGSEILEAWLPLGLCLVAAVWVPAESIAENHTRAGWVAVLRITAFVAAYFLLVAPVTFFAVKKTFFKRLQLLPPQPRWRVISTFILPATLAYVFSMSGGTIGFLIGALLGLVLVTVVFWLMFRLEPQDTANVYAVVGGTFFGTAAVSALLAAGLAALVNHAAASATPPSDLRENPLGPQFAWTMPQPAEPVAPLRRKTNTGVTAPEPPTNNQTPSVPLPSTPVSPPVATSGGATAPATPAGVQADPAHAPGTPDGTPSGEDPDLDPALKYGLFGNGGVAEGDTFVKAIQDAKLPWVKWAYRPSDQGIYEQTLSPISSSSPFVALFRVPGIGGRTIECCRLAPLYRGMGAIPLGEEGTDTVAAAGRYALGDDGSALLRLTSSATPTVEILPFRGAGGSVSLSVPAEFTKPGADPGLLAPELLGATPGHRFLIRWATADQTILQSYDFNSTGKPRLSIRLGQNDWPGVYAISPDGNSIAAPEREAEQTFIAVHSLVNAGAPPMLFPIAIANDKSRREPTGIGFSPDGSRLAALLEKGTDGSVQSWLIAGELRQAEGACKVPSADEMLGQIKGRPFDWIAGNKWLIHGRTVLDAATGATFGTLTDQVVTAQQMADDHTAYLSYLGTDGHPHLAVVKFNPTALSAKAAN